MSKSSDFELVLPTLTDRQASDPFEAPTLYYYFGYDVAQIVVHKSRKVYYVLSRGYRPHNVLTDKLFRSSYVKCMTTDFEVARIAFRNLVMEYLHDKPALFSEIMADGV